MDPPPVPAPAPAPELAPATAEALARGLPHVLASPRDHGRLELVVARPAPGERAVLAEAVLDPAAGLVGDSWQARGSRRTPDGAASPLMQVTVVNARAISLVAGSRDRWPLAGDQLYVDLALGGDDLPPGSLLAIGAEAVLEVTAPPHTGCAKFAERYGIDAARWVNGPDGRAHNLRGINTRVVAGGTVRPGDRVTRRR